MKITDLPTRFPIPFAKNAGGGFIRPIPQASQIGIENGAASLNDGFPPLTMTPLSSGGVPPFGKDMNGILNQTTAWLQWLNAGGAIPYDSSFQTTIVGYPRGAVLQDPSAGTWYYNLVDDNPNAPTSGNNWVPFSPINLYAQDTGTVNAGIITLQPTPSSQDWLVGRPIRVKKLSSDNSAAYTLNVNGFGAKQVVAPNGTQLPAGALPASGIYTVVYDGTKYQFQGASAGLAATGSLFVPGYFTLPTTGGTIYVQWAIGPWEPANPPTQDPITLNWAVSFPNACLAAWSSLQGEVEDPNIDAWSITYAMTQTTIRVQRQSNGTLQVVQRTRTIALGIGF